MYEYIKYVKIFEPLLPRYNRGALTNLNLNVQCFW